MLRYENKLLKFNYVGPEGRVKSFSYQFTDHKLGMHVFNYLHQLSYPSINGQQAVLTDREDLDFVAESIAKDKLANRQFSLALDYGYNIEDHDCYPTDEDEAAMGMDDLIVVSPRGYANSVSTPRLIARETIIREVYK